MPDPDVVHPQEPKLPAAATFADPFDGRAGQTVTEIHHPSPPRGRPRSGDSATSPVDARSYYGKPIVKEPIWKPEIGLYFFTGGLAGASCVLAAGARVAGNERLARTATLCGFAGVTVSPALLIKDLGRPRRFLNMLRVFKVTSPMSVGSWVLAALGTANGAAAACEVLGVLPRVRTGAELVAAPLGAVLSTYTAALVADTAVPAWHEGRRELPFVFAGGAAASAAAAALLVTPTGPVGAARRLLVGGATLELTAVQRMEHRLGDLAEPYHQGRVGLYTRAAKGLTATGALLTLAANRRPTLQRAAAALTLAGALSERFAVLRAGNLSARDPRYTVDSQRRRMAEEGRRGA